MPTLVTTDAAHTVLKKNATALRYTAYGHHSHNLGIAFTGVLWEQALLGYLLGHGYRLYMPTLMRFNAVDDHSPFHEGGIHGYAYCQGDPVNLIDPQGTVPVAVLKAMSRIARLNKSKPWTMKAAARAIERNKIPYRGLGHAKRLRPPPPDQVHIKPVQRVVGVPRQPATPSHPALVTQAPPHPAQVSVISFAGGDLQRLLASWPRH